MVIPIALGVVFLVIYLMFFLYDRLATDVDHYVIAIQAGSIPNLFKGERAGRWGLNRCVTKEIRSFLIQSILWISHLDTCLGGRRIPSELTEGLTGLRIWMGHRYCEIITL